MDYEQYQASIKAYKSGVIIHNDAVREWHEKYFDTAVSALSKMLVADHVKHSEDVEKFGADFASLVEIMDDATDDKNAIADELVAVDKEAKTKANAAIKKLGSMSHGINSKDEYMAAVSAYKNAHLEHGEWKKHKYIRIENGRYIYPEQDAKLRNSPLARNFGAGVSPKGAANQQKEMERPLKSAGRSIGDNTKVDERNMTAAADAARSEAAKKYANDLTDKIFETGKKYLTGDKDAAIHIDEELENLMEANKVEIGADQYNEVRSMAVSQALKRLDDFVNENGSQKLKDWWETDKKNLEKYFKTNRPFADKRAQVAELEKTKHISHSSNPREAFYAAVEDYKQQRVPV